MAKRFELKYPYAAYMDVSLMRETKTRREMLAEYNRMRAEAEKRLRRLEKYKWTQESEAYKYNKNRYRGASKLNKKEIAKLMRDAAEFLSSKSSTVQGLRESRDRAIETWREQHGMDFVNSRNFRDWGFFVGAARAAYGLQWVSGSGPELEALFRIARRDKINIAEQFGGDSKDLIAQKFQEWMDKATLSPSYEKYVAQAEKRQGEWGAEDYDRNPF